MNYEGTNFKKIYFKEFITTKLNNKEEEKKNLSKRVLPEDWNSKDFDYKQPWIGNKMTTKGYAVPTGKINNITVLDFDSKEVYNKACELVPDLHSYYMVLTRNGRHVYFLYDESIKSGKSKVTKVDVQNNSRFVIGPDTLLKRYTGHTFMYAFDGGKLKQMPEALRTWACELKEGGKQPRIHNSNIDYSYEVTDDECRDILDQLAVLHREYFDTYSTWITFTAIMKTLNKKDLWEEYSESYADGNFNKYENDKIWKKTNKKIPINFFCKELKIPSIKYHKKVAEDELYNEITYYEETTRFINNKFIEVTDDDFLKKDTILLESGPGTGKTTCVATLLNEWEGFNDGCTVLSIVNLISLANQQKITFEKIYKDLIMYNDKKVNASIIMANDSCICINSLWKLKNCDFRNKSVYIDEIYSLCISLTDNETLHNQREIENTLYRIIKTCKKLIVSDAHIHNNVMELINHRLFDTEKTYVHYCNEYQKFNGIPAVRFNDENKFFERLEKKVIAGESFSFACDNKGIVTDWFKALFAKASLETQSKMFLYTAGEDTLIRKDWKDKIIFYSPKITTGVDITCIKSSEQFIYITGQSVSSISLLQMATRTRNMKRLNYYSCARSFENH